jgi:hypothetical protein
MLAWLAYERADPAGVIAGVLLAVILATLSRLSG